MNPSGSLVLGSHRLEVCDSSAAEKPGFAVRSLGSGGKEDPVRLVFDTPTAPAINVSLIDLENRFRLIVNEVEAVSHPPLPKRPVARAVWRYRPDFKTALAAWIYAGSAHHTVYSYALKGEHMEDFAEVAGTRLIVGDNRTRLREFRNELRQNDLDCTVAQGLRS